MDTKKIKSIFKKVFILVIFIFLILGTLSGGAYYLYTQGTITLPEELEEKIHPTPPIKDEIGKFIILPHNYAPSDPEKQVFREQQFKTVFVVDGTAEDIEKLQSILNSELSYTPQYYPLSENSEFKKCNINIGEYDLIKGDCKPKHLVSHIVPIECPQIALCSSYFVQNIHKEESYFYIPSSPFTVRFPQQEMLIEQKAGVVLILWNETELPLNLSQRAYSLEYLDKEGKRISASGIVGDPNQVDYFLPPKNYHDEMITVKLRIWYKFNGEDLPLPEMITSQFMYDDFSLSSITTTPSNPVEMAWIPEWATPAGIRSVQKNPGKWDTISPTRYVTTDDGTIEYQYSGYDDELTYLMSANGIKMVPTIMNYSRDQLSGILHNHMQTHIDSIVNEANIHGYNGIDLDYETIYSADKDLLIEFLGKLATRLHETGKTLSFTAVPKLGDRKYRTIYAQTRQAQDWKAIGAVVDEFRIMAYDYTWQGSKVAGPMSPLPWDEALIIYALENMPANKIVLALPIYSHAWPSSAGTDLVGAENDQSLSSGQDNVTLSWQHDEIDYVKGHSEFYNESHNDWYAETYASMKYGGVEREMYYLTPADVAKRIELARKYGIKGVAYWRIGGDQL